MWSKSSDILSWYPLNSANIQKSQNMIIRLQRIKVDASLFKYTYTYYKMHGVTIKTMDASYFKESKIVFIPGCISTTGN